MKIFFITHYVTLLINFITAFVISYMSVKPIIVLSHAKGLTDLPGDRTSHNKPTATLEYCNISGFIFTAFIFLRWQFA